MNKKELKGLAKKVADLEVKMSQATHPKEKAKLQAEIMKLCGKVNSLEDISIMDDMILEILEKNS